MSPIVADLAASSARAAELPLESRPLAGHNPGQWGVFMSCPDVETIELFSEGALTERARSDVESHVQGCPACRERLREVRHHLDLAARVARAGACPSGAATILVPPRASTPAPAHVGGADSDETTPAAARRPAGARELPSASIPGYSILREISRGGQGVVFQAIQRSTNRKVAIKVLRDGHFSDLGDRARFEREAQVLGQLKHAGIVTIHDSGSADGHPFLVMDYISGKALDQWALDLQSQISDLKSQTTRSPLQASRRGGGEKAWLRRVLGVFAEVCEAVHAAHLRGIIHRDLKPSNIRVDENGRPHVLDFGLAKVSGAAIPAGPGAPDAVAAGASAGRGPEDASPAMTLTGQFLGSLPWSSPEQAEGQPSKMDIRTDVYSLGVILYQLLTGRFPYDVSGNLRDVIDRILRAEPLRPKLVTRSAPRSARGTVDPDARGSPSRIPGHTTGSAVDDEVETIVLKCLSKERDRRYQSAGELGRDIRRYLDGEPVEAKRDSLGYVLRTVLRRHRGAAVAALAFVMLTAGFSVAMGLQSLRLAAQRDRALAAEEQAAAAGREAQNEAAKAKVVNGFLLTMLRAPDPVAQGRDVTVAEVLDQASENLTTAFADQPAVRAALHDTLGLSYRGLGQKAKAAKQFRAALALRQRALGDTALETLQSRHNLAVVLQELDALEEAERIFAQVLEIAPTVSVEERRFAASVADSLADTLLRQGREAEAEPHFMRAIELRRSLPDAYRADLLLSMNNWPQLLIRQYRFAQAEEVLRETVGERAELGPQAHPHWITAQANLALAVSAQGRFAEAESLYGEALRAARDTLPENDRQTLVIICNLARTVQEAGRLDEAEALARDAHDRRRETLGAEHGETLIAANILADILIERGRLDAAEGLIARSLATLAAAPPGIPPLTTIVARANQAALHQAQGDASAAETELAALVTECARQFGTEHMVTARYRNPLGRARLTLGQAAAAEAPLRQAWESARMVRGEQHWQTAAFACDYAECLARLGRNNEARALGEPALASLRRTLGYEHPKARLAAEWLAALAAQSSGGEPR